MRVFGIDCGTEITGYGVVETDDTGRQPRLVMKAMGAIRLVKSKRRRELAQVFHELSANWSAGSRMPWHRGGLLLGERQVGAEAGQVRGVALLARRSRASGGRVRALTSIQRGGYGLAKKEQVVYGCAAAGAGEAPEPPTRRRPGYRICHIHTRRRWLGRQAAASFRLLSGPRVCFILRDSFENTGKKRQQADSTPFAAPLYVAFRGVRISSRFGGKAVRPLGQRELSLSVDRHRPLFARVENRRPCEPACSSRPIRQSVCSGWGGSRDHPTSGEGL